MSANFSNLKREATGFSETSVHKPQSAACKKTAFFHHFTYYGLTLETACKRNAIKQG
jgi:hypothetical protein